MHAIQPLAAILALTASVPSNHPIGDAIGFEGREIYRFADGIVGLVSGDWNGDGVQDLALVNRSRARVELLVRRPVGETGEPIGPTADEGELNVIEYDGRFRSVQFPIERRVWRLAAGDVDGDGRDDAVFASDGGRLSVITLEGDGASAKAVLRMRREVDGLRRGTGRLEVEDLDGDGRGDVLARGEEALYAISVTGPDDDPSLGAAEILDYPDDSVDGIHLVDLNGDGRTDLLTVHHEDEHPFRARMREMDGTFGPRNDVSHPPIRAHAVSDVDGDGRPELACILQLSGRVACLRPTVTDEPQWQRHPLDSVTSDEKRTFTIADIDRDGTSDILVANATSSRVLVLAGRAGRLSPLRVEAPTLAGAAHPRVGNIDGDDRADLLVVSGPERMIGTSAWTDAGLTFPRTFAADGEPAAADLYDVDGDGFDDAVVLSTRGEGRRREYLLGTWRGGPEGLAAEAETVALEGFDRVPAGLRVGDLDRDGRADYLFYPSGQNDLPRLFFGTDEGPRMDERGDEAPGIGILEGAGPGRATIADLDGDGQDELLIAAETFARALWLERVGPARWLPRVIDQWPVPAKDAKLDGVGSADRDGDGKPELVLRSASGRDSYVLDPEDGSVRVRIESDRLGLRYLGHGDLDGDGHEEVCSIADQQVAFLPGTASQAGALAFEEVAGHAPPEWARLDQLAAADLDGDGADELIATEVTRHSLRILAGGTTSGPDLATAVAFRVFEEKTFGAGSNTREPRELTVCDLTGDGRADIAVLVHDKLILYPQP